MPTKKQPTSTTHPEGDLPEPVPFWNTPLGRSIGHIPNTTVSRAAGEGDILHCPTNEENSSLTKNHPREGDSADAVHGDRCDDTTAEAAEGDIYSHDRAGAALTGDADGGDACGSRDGRHQDENEQKDSDEESSLLNAGPTRTANSTVADSDVAERSKASAEGNADMAITEPSSGRDTATKETFDGPHQTAEIKGAITEERKAARGSNTTEPFDAAEGPVPRDMGNTLDGDLQQPPECWLNPTDQRRASEKHAEEPSSPQKPTKICDTTGQTSPLSDGVCERKMVEPHVAAGTPAQGTGAKAVRRLAEGSSMRESSGWTNSGRDFGEGITRQTPGGIKSF